MQKLITPLQINSALLTRSERVGDKALRRHAFRFHLVVLGCLLLCSSASASEASEAFAGEVLVDVYIVEAYEDNGNRNLEASLKLCNDNSNDVPISLKFVSYAHMDISDTKRSYSCDSDWVEITEHDDIAGLGYRLAESMPADSTTEIKIRINQNSTDYHHSTLITFESCRPRTLQVYGEVRSLADVEFARNHTYMHLKTGSRKIEVINPAYFNGQVKWNLEQSDLNKFTANGIISVMYSVSYYGRGRITSLLSKVSLILSSVAVLLAALTFMQCRQRGREISANKSNTQVIE